MGLHFLDLFDMAPDVAGCQQYPLVGINQTDSAMLPEMVPQIISSGSDIVNEPVVAPLEMCQQLLLRSPPARGLQAGAGLSLARAVRHGLQDEIILARCLDPPGWLGGRLQDLLGEQLEIGVLGNRDVLRTLRDGPDLRRRLEPPLGLGESGKSAEKQPAARFELAGGEVSILFCQPTSTSERQRPKKERGKGATAHLSPQAIEMRRRLSTLSPPIHSFTSVIRLVSSHNSNAHDTNNVPFESTPHNALTQLRW